MIESFFWITLCVYFEARGEPEAGQVAVVHTILNRSIEREQSVIEVIKAPGQFSWIHDDIPDKIDDFPAFLRCAKSVEKALQHRLEGFSMSGVNHYYNPAKVSPSWSAAMHEVAVIGNHRFLKG